MALVFWQGSGYLVALIVFGCSLVGNLIFDHFVGKGYYDHHKWPLAVSLAVSAGFCWLLGNYYRKRPGQVVIDKQTGKKFLLNSRHTLFSVPLHKWPVILLACSLICFAWDFFAGKQG